MSEGILESRDFDRYTSLSEQAARDAAMAANGAFHAAMTIAIRRGRENAKPGTYVDTTPPIGAIRIRGEIAISACGSPAQMCMEIGGAPSGAESMK